MKKLFFVAALFTLMLPFAYTPSTGNNQAVPFSTVALAGHTAAGSWCQCGCPACICDPGEIPTFCDGNGPSPITIDEKPNKSDRPGRTRPDNNDPLSVGLVFAVLFFFWIRFRG